MSRPAGPTRYCTVDDCTGKHRAKGMCIRHYSNMEQTGTTMGAYELKIKKQSMAEITGRLSMYLESLLDEAVVLDRKEINYIMELVGGNKNDN